MPGSFYALILILFVISLSARIEPLRKLSLEDLKIMCSIAGLAFIVGYMRNQPKRSELRRYLLK